VAIQAETRSGAEAGQGAALAVLAAISFGHFLNDLLQSLLPSIYPLLKQSFSLSFVQVGIIQLVFQVTASLLQPLMGLRVDKRTRDFGLPAALAVMLLGILALAVAWGYWTLLVAATLVGLGSSMFHPEASRIARLAAGGRPGLAQSFFQVGGTCGSAVGPLFAAYLIMPNGRGSVAWLALAAIPAMLVLSRVGTWHGRQSAARRRAGTAEPLLPPNRIAWAIGILMLLLFSKFFYLASIGSYLTFYLIDRFQVPVQTAQLYLFAFSAASAAGTFLGGPIGDRVGRKYLIWASILGALPFSLALPHANLFWTGILVVLIGAIISAAFTAIVVYGQELVPHRVGAVSGLFFGFAFGSAGIGAAVLGAVADWTGIGFVYQVCGFLPALGLVAAFLPDLEAEHRRVTVRA
jgi:FSR family fosmidomycin resistance protein-like MFS transporter